MAGRAVGTIVDMSDDSAPTGSPLVERMAGFGTTIFAEMSELAARTGAINLGQGFPDVDGHPAVIDAAVRAMRSGHNQYPPGPGVPELRRAIAAHQSRRYGIDVDPDTEVLVTTGATEGIAASILALCGPGDEVVTFEPYFDSYAAVIALAGAQRRVVTLRAPDFAVDVDAVAASITPRTKVLLLNSPHNPTGAVFSDDEMTALAELCVRHDLIAVSDEVYEHLTFDGIAHRPFCTFPGMADRTLTISSAGKTFSFTGWKVGWVTGPGPLVAATRTVKQFLTYVSGGPFQYAVAEALELPGSVIGDLRDSLESKRDRLSDGLEAAGFETYRPSGTYFVTVDVRSVGWDDGVEFCRMLPERVGVVAIPNSVFHDSDAGRSQVRFAFCKRDEVLDDAVDRLAKVTEGGPR